MPNEGFFHRWSRLKSDHAVAAPDTGTVHPAEANETVAASDAGACATPGAPSDPSGGQGDMVQGRQPTLDDVARLGADSDYSPFVARGVDKSVQRSAMKKLFSDPHFNIGDGLDLYMGDYNKPDPMPAAMLAALQHSRSFFAQAYPEQAEAEPRAPSVDTAESIINVGDPDERMDDKPADATSGHIVDDTAAPRGAEEGSA